jgi:hypothetical protein
MVCYFHTNKILELHFHVSDWIILYLLRLSSDLKATEEVMFLALRFVGLIKTGLINMRRHI